MTEAEIRGLWQAHGGMFDGPHVEVASACADGLLAFARSLIAAERESIAEMCDEIAAHWVKSNGEESISAGAARQVASAIRFRATERNESTG